MSIETTTPDDAGEDFAPDTDGDDTDLTWGSGEDPFGPESDLEEHTLSLFEGDEGRLDLDQRRTMVALMKNRYISAAQHPQEWRTLTSDPVTFKSRLNDMFLDLHIDAENEVAHKRQALPEGGGRFPTLLHDIAYNREETLLLVYLRQKYQSEMNAGLEVVILDRDDMIEYVAGYRPSHATDHSGDERRVANAVESLMKAKILLKTPDPARLRVSPVLPVLLPMPRLHELYEWLMAENGTTPDRAGDGRDSADGSEDRLPLDPVTGETGDATTTAGEDRA